MNTAHTSCGLNRITGNRLKLIRMSGINSGRHYTIKSAVAAAGIKKKTRDGSVDPYRKIVEQFSDSPWTVLPLTVLSYGRCEMWNRLGPASTSQWKFFLRTANVGGGGRWPPPWRAPLPRPPASYPGVWGIFDDTHTLYSKAVCMHNFDCFS